MKLFASSPKRYTIKETNVSDNNFTHIMTTSLSVWVKTSLCNPSMLIACSLHLVFHCKYKSLFSLTCPYYEVLFQQLFIRLKVIYFSRVMLIKRFIEPKSNNPFCKVDIQNELVSFIKSVIPF